MSPTNLKKFQKMYLDGVQMKKIMEILAISKATFLKTRRILKLERPRVYSLIGKRYKKWTVISQPQINEGVTMSLCQCQCGTERMVRHSNLTHGRSKGCGCTKEGRTSPEEALINAVLASYMVNSKRRKIVWAITKEQLTRLVLSPCYYCGSVASNVKKTKGQLWELRHNGIDRKDPDVGYTLDNCVPCCKICNVAKWLKNENQFYEWVKRVELFQALQFPKSVRKLIVLREKMLKHF